MTKPKPHEIPADSTSLLKDDPRVAEVILDPAPPGSRAERKLKALRSLIAKQTPSVNAPPSDPLGHLQRAIATVIHGQANRPSGHLLGGKRPTD